MLKLNRNLIFHYITVISFIIQSGVSVHSKVSRDSLSLKMFQAQIIPDIIKSAPELELRLKFGDLEVKPGMELKPTQVKNMPSYVGWSNGTDSDGYVSLDQFYCLVMFDPDAPSRSNPINAAWKHWLIVNIHGTNITQGETLSEYISSGPAKNSGLHRYIFLIYQQSGQLNFNSEPKLNNHSPKGRANFSLQAFTTKYNLGEPIAGNFYEAGWDEYVNELYQLLDSDSSTNNGGGNRIEVFNLYFVFLCTLYYCVK